mmetsp:Transcript_30294/g.77771  ORF Transcript_30294/g.77771 Transcript_30294/m.77771 type:complete len:335 (-) Transcript_30294:535-1539(-)
MRKAGRGSLRGEGQRGDDQRVVSRLPACIGNGHVAQTLRRVGAAEVEVEIELIGAPQRRGVWPQQHYLARGVPLLRGDAEHGRLQCGARRQPHTRNYYRCGRPLRQAQLDGVALRHEAADDLDGTRTEAQRVAGSVIRQGGGVEQQVGGALRDAAQPAVRACQHHRALHLRRRRRRVALQVQGRGRRHQGGRLRGAGQRPGGSVVRAVCRQDVRPRGKQVHAGSGAGELKQAVAPVGGADGDGAPHARGAVLARVAQEVARRVDDRDAIVQQALHRQVQAGRAAAEQRQQHHRGAPGLGTHGVDARHHRADHPLAGAVQHPHWHDPHILGGAEA